ncbi:hypothetical protein QYF36_026646 [Acer negundo]|nr:hypothetical protein QYF36_026646 [Acer negundo]
MFRSKGHLVNRKMRVDGPFVSHGFESAFSAAGVSYFIDMNEEGRRGQGTSRKEKWQGIPGINQRAISAHPGEKLSQRRDLPLLYGTRADRADKDKGLAVAKETLKDRVTQLDGKTLANEYRVFPVKESRAVFMGPQRSRWRCPKRDGDGLGQIEVRSLLWR